MPRQSYSNRSSITFRRATSCIRRWGLHLNSGCRITFGGPDGQIGQFAQGERRRPRAAGCFDHLSSCGLLPESAEYENEQRLAQLEDK
jgi:hypothetical protein